MPLNFALLGAGRIGKVHAQAINADPGATLAAISDAVPAAAEAIAKKSGCTINTIDEIAANAGIDAVVICTPTNTHADLIEQFAHAGKAVFCEKPIDLDIERVKTCLATVAKTNAKLMVGFNRRFDPDFLALRQSIKTDQIGEIEMIQITSRDPGAPPPDYIKVSGGIFRDMSIHDFDMARFLLNEEIESVFSTGSVLTDPEIGALDDYDSVSIIMTTKSGKHCAISNSRRATYGYDQRIEIHGSKGMVTALNQSATSIEVANAGGFTRPPLHDFFMTRYTAAYAAEIAAFVKTVRDDIPASPSGRDGLEALRLAEAALKSAKIGRTVKVSEIGS